MSEPYLSQARQSVYVRPVRSIGGLYMDVTVEETHNDELEITDHPVEQGAAITDHAYMKPAQVTIRAGVSDAGKSGNSGDRPSVEAYQKLLELQKSREPFDLVTGKRTYKNMLIRSLAVTTEAETENILMFTAELRQVMLVTVQSVAVPRSRQKYGNVTGGVDQKGQKQLVPVVPRSGMLSLSGGKGYRRSS